MPCLLSREDVCVLVWCRSVWYKTGKFSPTKGGEADPHPHAEVTDETHTYLFHRPCPPTTHSPSRGHRGVRLSCFLSSFFPFHPYLTSHINHTFLLFSSPPSSHRDRLDVMDWCTPYRFLLSSVCCFVAGRRRAHTHTQRRMLAW